MAMHAQINIRKGNKIARIHSGWGLPKMVFAALRETAATGRKTPQAIAKEFIRRYEDASFGLSIIAEDFQQNALRFIYTVDVATMPWRVVQEPCVSQYRFTKEAREKLSSIGMPVAPPARRRTVLIGAK